MTKLPSPASTTKEPTLADKLKRVKIKELQPEIDRANGREQYYIAQHLAHVARQIDETVAALESRPDTRIEELRAKVEAEKAETEARILSEVKEIEEDGGWSGDNIEWIAKHRGRVQAYEIVLKLLNPPEREQPKASEGEG